MFFRLQPIWCRISSIKSIFDFKESDCSWHKNSSTRRLPRFWASPPGSDGKRTGGLSNWNSPQAWPVTLNFTKKKRVKKQRELGELGGFSGKELEPLMGVWFFGCCRSTLAHMSWNMVCPLYFGALNPPQKSGDVMVLDPSISSTCQSIYCLSYLCIPNQRWGRIATNRIYCNFNLLIQLSHGMLQSNLRICSLLPGYIWTDFAGRRVGEDTVRTQFIPLVLPLHFFLYQMTVCRNPRSKKILVVTITGKGDDPMILVHDSTRGYQNRSPNFSISFKW